MEAVNNYLVVKKEVIEEKRSAGGIILNVPSAFDFGDEFTNKNICYAEVMYANENIPFLKCGDRIALNPHKGTKAAIDYEDYTVILKEQFLSKIVDGKFIVPPESIMIKIKKDDRDSLFSKWIIRNDGTRVQLFLQSEPEKEDIRRSQIFVSVGEIVQVGENVKGIEAGDIGILDYTVDNFTDNVLYYDDDKNKYVVIDGTTTYHTGDTWVYADRKIGRDTLVSRKGDMEIISPLLGVIRKDKLIARQPYVFLAHKSNTIEAETRSGIKYSYNEEILEREVLSVSEWSHKKYGIYQGQRIVIEDCNVFQVKLSDKTIDCILDDDIFGGYKK